MMRTFGFSIVVSGVDTTSTDYETAFYEAGCDDALVCVQGGVCFLDFNREGKNFKDAVETAISDINKAGATAEQVWKHMA